MTTASKDDNGENSCVGVTSTASQSFGVEHADAAGELRQKPASAPAQRLKRFYKDAGLRSEPDDVGATSVLLDSRPVKTPGRNLLTLPSQRLAEAIADEWRQQDTYIEPATMPLTRLANTTIDGILVTPDAVRDEIVAFAGQDLIYYRADHPVELSQRQDEVWAPFVSWAQEHFDAKITLTAGIMPVTQSDGLLAGARAHVASIDPWLLGPLHIITTLTGSAVMALAHVSGHADAESIWTAAHIDEDWQIAQWGEDAEAAQRRATRHAEMLSASRFARLLAGLESA